MCQGGLGTLCPLRLPFSYLTMWSVLNNALQVTRYVLVHTCTCMCMPAHPCITYPACPSSPPPRNVSWPSTWWDPMLGRSLRAMLLPFEREPPNQTLMPPSGSTRPSQRTSPPWTAPRVPARIRWSRDAEVKHPLTKS